MVRVRGSVFFRGPHVLYIKEGYVRPAPKDEGSTAGQHQVQGVGQGAKDSTAGRNQAPQRQAAVIRFFGFARGLSIMALCGVKCPLSPVLSAAAGELILWY